MKQARITRLHPILSPPKNEEAPFFDPCPKFQKQYHPKCSLDRIISYLFLKQNDINGKTFSQRRICKLDATQTFDGPAKCRVLKIHPPDANKINGWQNVGGEVSYDYDNGWKTRLADICTDIQEDINIMRKVLMDEGEQKHNYKARIEYLRRYIEEINKMYHIVNLKEDIKKLRGIYRKSREEIKSYVKFKGTRFFEIIPQLKQVSKTPTILDEFKVFKPLSDEKLIEKQKYLDDLFKHLNKKNQQKVIQEQLEQLDQLDQLLQNPGIKIDPIQPDPFATKDITVNKEIEKKFVFEEFIEESKQYEDEQEAEQQDEIIEDTENNKTNNQRPKRAFSQIISSKQQDKKSAAQEFNSQHYLFEVKDVNSFGQQIRLNRLNKIMNEMFKDQRNFSQDLQQYSYNHIKPQTVSNISCDNLQSLKHKLVLSRDKELKRMNKQTTQEIGKRSSVHVSAFYSTATSKQQLRIY
ncbi:unnamed protein product [Paramecium sonneborni]|uniref:Uncharacterized protein n=1 Tax=Paramecium sonneborni TaxID=65129 RepID=A0A8S1LNV5_9CILI|nr:unnamed protein product [Paramecium sonneborni]